MSKESKRLRSRAANELRQSRTSTSEPLKAIHKARAASLRVLARNEEWLTGEPDRSAPIGEGVKALDADRFNKSIKRW